MRRFIMLMAIWAAGISTASYATKHTDPFNKNGALGKKIRNIGSNGKDTMCVLGLMVSGAYGVSCAGCATAATSVTVWNPLLGATYSACVPVCVKAVGFVSAAWKDCGVKL